MNISSLEQALIDARNAEDRRGRKICLRLGIRAHPGDCFQHFMTPRYMREDLWEFIKQLEPSITFHDDLGSDSPKDRSRILNYLTNLKLMIRVYEEYLKQEVTDNTK